MFTGDQLGTLFAHQVFETYKASGKPIGRYRMMMPLTTSA